MLELMAVIVFLVLLCVVVGLEKVKSARETKKFAGRTKPMDEKEMYW